MNKSGILAALLGAALASPIALVAQSATPTFTVTVTIAGGVKFEALGTAGGGTTTTGTSFSEVDSLVLKQVPVPVAASPTTAPAPAISVTPGPTQPPCLYTLTLTQFGDDDALCSAILSAIQNPAQGAVTVEIDFAGIGSAQEYYGSPQSAPVTTPDSLVHGTNVTGAPSIQLTNPLSICWNDQPGDDDDFDDLADFGMNKVTMTFTQLNFISAPTVIRGPGGSSY
jgi:hypothetical protein